MSAEISYAGAGALAIVGGAIREGEWPAKGWTTVLATVALVIVASLSNNTKIEPLVKAIGVLFFLAAAMAAITAAQKKRKK